MATSSWMVTGSRGTTERHNDQSRSVYPFAPPRTCVVVAPAVGLSRSGLRPRLRQPGAQPEQPIRPARCGSKVRGGESVVRRPGGCGGPEFGGAAAGEGRVLGAAGGGERVECLVDAVGGEVAVQRSRSWVRVSPSGARVSAAWICSASGSPVACPSAQAAERAA